MPYTILRPFNCVGVGERRALRDTKVTSGNFKLALSHVVPDLVVKVLKGQDPLHILGSGDQVRHYTYGGDLARGIRIAMESPEALNDDDFNLSTAASTTVRELAEMIWTKINGERPPVTLCPRRALRVRRPAVRARHAQGSRRARLRGDDITLGEMLDEVIPWIRAEHERDASQPSTTTRFTRHRFGPRRSQRADQHVVATSQRATCSATGIPPEFGRARPGLPAAATSSCQTSAPLNAGRATCATKSVQPHA